MADAYLSDEDIDGMFEPYQEETGSGMAIAPAQQSAPLPFYPLAQAPGSSQPGIVELATRKVGPLPMWAWLLIGGSVAGAGYFYYRHVRKDGDDEGSSPRPNVGDVVSVEPDEEARSGWQPSRSAIAQQLEQYFSRKGQSAHITVWSDADEAKQKGRLTAVSPLVNVQVKGGTVKVDATLQRFCRREGLNPIAHKDGSIGLYPHDGSKRGREWEEYVDALRDDGQKV
jgi:hypothetical protein